MDAQENKEKACRLMGEGFPEWRAAGYPVEEDQESKIPRAKAPTSNTQH